eukprot:snap_masked-scaffold_10-processed-gene-7.14-mRNA-1 protein AED:1.00 eAED:1.00 QI:0/-1/0/0/-1/1/1/0/285
MILTEEEKFYRDALMKRVYKKSFEDMVQSSKLRAQKSMRNLHSIHSDLFLSQEDNKNQGLPKFADPRFFVGDTHPHRFSPQKIFPRTVFKGGGLKDRERSRRVSRRKEVLKSKSLQTSSFLKRHKFDDKFNNVNYCDFRPKTVPNHEEFQAPTRSDSWWKDYYKRIDCSCTSLGEILQDPMDLSTQDIDGLFKSRSLQVDTSQAIKDHHFPGSRAMVECVESNQHLKKLKSCFSQRSLFASHQKSTSDLSKGLPSVQNSLATCSVMHTRSAKLYRQTFRQVNALK